MSNRANKRRIYQLLHDRFHGKTLWRSAEEQAWLDVTPVGRECGSPDYERLQILDLYAAGQIASVDAMRILEMATLEDLHQLMLAADLIVTPLIAVTPSKGVLRGRAPSPSALANEQGHSFMALHSSHN